MKTHKIKYICIIVLVLCIHFLDDYRDMKSDAYEELSSAIKLSECELSQNIGYVVDDQIVYKTKCEKESIEFHDEIAERKV